MNEYTVFIRLELEDSLVVKAKTEEEALKKAEEQYDEDAFRINAGRYGGLPDYEVELEHEAEEAHNAV